MFYASYVKSIQDQLDKNKELAEKIRKENQLSIDKAYQEITKQREIHSALVELEASPAIH